jgi:hypothetical protein
MAVLDFASAKASALRYKLRNPPNAVPDHGINMRNGRPVPYSESARPYSPGAEYRNPQWDYVVVRMHPVVNIINLVAEAHGVSPYLLSSKLRYAHLVEPRQIAMWLCRKLTAHSHKDIGRRFGGRDHSTVVHAVTKIEDQRKADPEFDARLNQFIAVLDPMRAA